MYIGQFEMYAIDDAWPKNSQYNVRLFIPGPDNSLQQVLNENGTPKIVAAMNVVGTFAYKDAPQRYCMVTEMNGTYWVVSAEC